MTIHRETFYRGYRTEFGALNQPQVDGLNLILDFLDRDGLPPAWEAYLLATTYHECARTWRPIEEDGRDSYFDKYEPGTKLGTVLGNTKRGDGLRYKGRGYVQLTGRRNYAWASTLPLKVDFEATPEAACEPEFAWAIMVAGVTVGAFTGRKLGAYLPRVGGLRPDYVNARRVINGTDKAELIASYAGKFEALLTAARLKEKPPAPKPVEEADPAPERVILGGDVLALTARAEAAENELASLKAAILALLK